METSSADHGLAGDGEDRWLTVEELAARWKLTKAAIYQRNRRGDGPTVHRLGKRVVRYKLSDVIAYENTGRIVHETRRAAS